MSEDMLMSFDSPLEPPRVVSRTQGMIPLIPCPTVPGNGFAEAAVEDDPFESVLKAAVDNDDPFENVFKTAMEDDGDYYYYDCVTNEEYDRLEDDLLEDDPLEDDPIDVSKTTLIPSVKTKAVSLPGSPTSPKKMRGLSELDISAAVTGLSFVSSTPNPAGILRSHGPPVSPLIGSTLGTPTRRHNSVSLGSQPAPRRSVINGVMEMSADNLRIIIQKKMERLKSINENLSSFGRLNQRMSLSTPDLPKLVESLNVSRECGFNELTPSKLSRTLTPRNQRDNTDDVTPIKISSLKKEALKISSIFQNITVDLDDGLDDTLDTPIKRKTIRRCSKSYAGEAPQSPDDLLYERPPWEWSGSSSEDEDGLPKIVRLRVSSKRESRHSPGTVAILDRYKKTRSSLQFDDDDKSKVQPQSHSNPKECDKITTKVPAASAPFPPTQETKSALVIQQPPVPETIIGELKPKTATANIVKKGPLKAMMPLPNMIKASDVIPPSMQKTIVKTSAQGLRGRGNSMIGTLRRSNSNSSMIRQPPNPLKSPKQNTQLKPQTKIEERPTSAPSPSNGVLKSLAARGRPPLKRRPLGKENLMKK